MTLRHDDTVQFNGREFFERLEGRTLLGGDPFPLLTDLENANDTVVRIETSMGVIDIEMFDGNPATDAPITVANFLDYVRDGDWDETFFHRLVSGFVLQGGGFRYEDTPPGITQVPQEATIQNEFSRTNAERTLAMAKLGGDPNSATSQWFFNLANNAGTPPNGLDFQNGGFTVFARVVNDASWGVVQQIAGLQVRNFTATTGFNGQFAGNFQSVPVVSGFNSGDGVQESEVIRILDIEVIKAKDSQLFFEDKFFYPEGFAGSTINEFLPIGNPNNETVYFQVIARSEVAQGTTWFRDRVINFGVIAANTRGGITISQFGAGGAPGINDLLPQGVPYSLEVHATRPLSVNLSHYDFGTSTGEAFTTSPATTWTFAEARKNSSGDNIFDFLVWQNMNDVAANVTITFFFETNLPVATSVRTEMNRRGGLNIDQLGTLPDGVSSIQITSDQPIVAAITHFNSSGDQTGSTSLGVAGNASNVGVVALASDGALVGQTISFLNSNSIAAVVSFTLSFNTGNDLELPASLIIPPQSRGTFDFGNVAQVQDERRFSVRYSSNAAVWGEVSHTQYGDEVAYPVPTLASTVWQFAEGFMDPSRAGVDLRETVSIYNPNFAGFGDPPAAANISVRFMYSDGFVLTESFSIAGGGRRDLDLHNLASILDQGNNHARFFYSVEVSSNIPVVAQMWHYDLTLGNLQPSGGFGTLGTPTGTTVRLDA
ncbi:MAG: peptidylprolyl isomerase [Phycisphaerales bacterium]|nr:peptidylprolyl isomerase [Phycisphaerales bacterium]